MNFHLLRAENAPIYAAIAVLVAWQAGEMSEMQACKLLKTDVVGLRQIRNDLFEHAVVQWQEWRTENPPDPGPIAPLVVASSSEGQPDNKGCPPDCGHSTLEHQAFDRGVRDGETGKSADECPYKRPLLIEAWENGQSVGEMNRTDI